MWAVFEGAGAVRVNGGAQRAAWSARDCPGRLSADRARAPHRGRPRAGARRGRALPGDLLHARAGLSRGPPARRPRRSRRTRRPDLLARAVLQQPHHAGAPGVLHEHARPGPVGALPGLVGEEDAGVGPAAACSPAARRRGRATPTGHRPAAARPGGCGRRPRGPRRAPAARRPRPSPRGPRGAAPSAEMSARSGPRPARFSAPTASGKAPTSARACAAVRRTPAPSSAPSPPSGAVATCGGAPSASRR